MNHAQDHILNHIRLNINTINCAMRHSSPGNKMNSNNNERDFHSLFNKKDQPNSNKTTMIKFIISALALCLLILFMNQNAAVPSKNENVLISDYSEKEKIQHKPLLTIQSTAHTCQTTKCQRIENYCNQGKVLGSEGNLKGIDLSKYELHTLLITHRHGDRAPIHTIPGDVTRTTKQSNSRDSSSTSSSSSLSSLQQSKSISKTSNDINNNNNILKEIKLYNPNALLSLKKYNLNHFSIHPLTTAGETATDINEHSPITHFIHALDSKVIFQKSDMNLPQGQLTSTGYMQLSMLGDHLHKAYESFITTLSSSEGVYIRSTNYHRTIQSVAALVSKLLPIAYTNTSTSTSSSGSSGSGSSGSNGIGRGAMRTTSTSSTSTIASSTSSSSSTTNDKSTNNENRHYTINAYVNELDEIMHGVGMKYTSHSVDPIKGETPLQGSCSKAYNLTQAFRFTVAADVKKELGMVVQNEYVMRKRHITDFVDASLPRYCHQQPLPCIYSAGSSAAAAAAAAGGSTASATTAGTAISPTATAAITTTTASKSTTTATAAATSTTSSDTPNSLLQCKPISEELLADMMSEADRLFCTRYSGPQSQESTNLSFYPFFKEIIDKLKLTMSRSILPITSTAAVATDTTTTGLDATTATTTLKKSTTTTLKSSSNKSNNKIIIFSGHDTVIAPVLSVLGVYPQSGQCDWVPLASRIVFELWLVKKSVNQHTAAATTGNINTNNFYVRVFYNGKDVTALIPVCVTAMKPQQESALCPFTALETLLDSLIKPYHSLQEACSSH